MQENSTVIVRDSADLKKKRICPDGSYGLFQDIYSNVILWGSVEAIVDREAGMTGLYFLFLHQY
jgi:hypothetical protein